METDVSYHALGCVLSQRDELRKLHPVGYYTRSFPQKSNVITQLRIRNYLPLSQGLGEWKHPLIGAKEAIQIFADHKNLLFASKPLNDRYVPSAIIRRNFCRIVLQLQSYL